MTLHCTKTGRHWPCASNAHAETLARNLSLKDWELCPSGSAPATMRETSTESRERLRYGRG